MLSGLAYLGIESPDHRDWNDFATVLGAQVVDGTGDEVVRVRVDDAAWRISVSSAPRDALGYIGWFVESERALDEAAAAVAARGIATTVADQAELDDRCVDRMVWFVDPWGFRHEICYGQVSYPNSFHASRAMSGFVTGGQGLGHVVLVVPDLPAAHAFYTEVLGFRLTDKVVIDGRAAHFYHCSSRHHSLAIASSDSFTGVNHLMLEVGSIDDVGSAYDVCRDADIPFRKGIGRHANDGMISFYVRAPSGLNIEYGTGGLAVEGDWVPRTYRQNSVWGHRSTDDPRVGMGLPVPTAP